MKENLRLMAGIVVMAVLISWMLFPGWFKVMPAHAVSKWQVGKTDAIYRARLGDMRVLQGEEDSAIVEEGRLRLDRHGKATLKFDPIFKRDPSCSFPNSYVIVRSHAAEKYELEGHAFGKVNYECQGVKHAE